MENCKLIVDKEVCIACGACYGSAPELFEADEELKSTVKKQPENEVEIKQAKDAVANCPVGAIKY